MEFKYLKDTGPRRITVSSEPQNEERRKKSTGKREKRKISPAQQRE
jgi:hypothetical protein